MSFLSQPEEDFEYDRETLKQVVHYICAKVDDLRSLSKTKLHKILYYVDREVYLDAGRPLTGEEYVKHQYGPYSTHLDEVLEELEEEGKLSHLKREDSSRQLGQYEQNIFVAKEEPAVDDSFTPSQVQLLDEVTETISQKFTSQQISELSHDIVWRAARKGEQIPYYTTLLQVTDSEEDAEDMAWARKKAQEIE